MVNVAHLIINQSLRRKENKGGFYNSDNVKNNSIPMRTLIKESIAKAVTYQDYNSMVKLLVAEKRTSGIEHTQEKIEFTKLNASRSKRLDKTINLSEKELAHFKNIGVSQTWLVLTETWCGDAAHTLPILNKIAEASPKIDLKIVFRDENETLMNAFLTNGTKSVPKLVILDDNYNVLASWGPRSRAATQMVETYKLRHGKLGDNFKKDLQVWYNKDQGQSLLKDLISLTLKAPIFSNILEPIS